MSIDLNQPINAKQCHKYNLAPLKQFQVCTASNSMKQVISWESIFANFVSFGWICKNFALKKLENPAARLFKSMTTLTLNHLIICFFYECLPTYKTSNSYFNRFVRCAGFKTPPVWLVENIDSMPRHTWPKFTSKIKSFQNLYGCLTTCKKSPSHLK